jgi:hypothetical protein
MDLIKDTKGKHEDDELGARDWTYIRKQCFEMDVTTAVANGGNYVKGTLLLKLADI